MVYEQDKKYIYAVAYFLLFFVTTFLLLKFSSVIVDSGLRLLVLLVVCSAAIVLLLTFPMLYMHKKVSRKTLYLVLYSSAAVILAYFIFVLIKIL